MSPLLATDSTAEDPAPSTTWTSQLLGDDVTGSINELSATNVNITAAGTTDSNAVSDGTIAYQQVASGDIQLICKVPATWTGTLENFTQFGLQLLEALSGNPVRFQCSFPEVDDYVRCKKRTAAEGAFTTHATGVTALVRPGYIALTYNDSSNEVRFWQSTDGVSDNYLQVGSTISQTMNYPVYACLWGTAHNNAVTATAALTNCSLGTSITISQAAGDAPRNIRGHLTWESGGINANGTIVDGLYTDGMFMQIITPKHAARTITDITDNDSTATATYTGTQVVEGDGLTLGTISSGMTEMSGRLIRVGSSPTSSSFSIFQDGDDDGYNPTKVNGNVRTSTVGYGTWTGTTTAQGWNAIHSGQGNPTIPTDADVRVVSSITPPTNAIGAANEVLPLVGSKLLSSAIYYWKDNSCENGISNALGNSGKNKPRWSSVLSNGQEFNQGESEKIGFAVNLPSNYDHEETLTGVVSRNQVYLIGDSSGSGTCEIHLRGNGSGTDQWELDHAGGSGVVLGSVADDVGKWTVFIIEVLPDPTAGILKIWKSTGEYTDGFERVDTLVYDQTTGRVGPASGGTVYKHNIRQYKGSWHFNNATINSTVFWLGFDEGYFGGVNESTTFEDVHPFRHSEP